MRRVSPDGLLLSSVCVRKLYLGTHYLQRAVIAETTPAALVALLLAMMSASITGYTGLELGLD
ncbi:hypothetical protein U8335_03840 [Roseiconus lacunae]|uniref:hypothetical protein n=1 Tax=Roseiconus lacunae TaxID=2605694 RepID=UPI003086CFE1|nr:hypothetical protein U8335_03840 [Stieleria sp. HD01]